jgi:hypothetical protein
MTKIIKAALSTKYANEQIANLLTIIEATPNPETAVEIALGLYSLPNLAPKGILEKGNEKIEVDLLRYDIWQNTVYFQHEVPKGKALYVLLEDVDYVDYDNYRNYEADYTDRRQNPEKYEYVTVYSTKETTIATDYVYLDKWETMAALWESKHSLD